MENKFQILPFQIGDFSKNGIILYSLRGISEIIDKNVISILYDLKSFKTGYILEKKYLKQLGTQFNINFNRLCNFFTKDICVLRVIPGQFKRYNEIFFISDNTEIPFFQKEIETVSGISCRYNKNINLIKENSIVVLYQEKYNSSQITNIYKIISSKKKISCMSSYVLGRSFIIDGLYIQGALVACHFCGIERKRYLSNKKQTNQNYNWNYFQKYIIDNNSAQSSEKKFSFLDSMLCLAFLKRNIIKIVGPEMESPTCNMLLETSQFEIDSFFIEKYNTSIWPECSCLANKYTG